MCLCGTVIHRTGVKMGSQDIFHPQLVNKSNRALQLKKECLVDMFVSNIHPEILMMLSGKSNAQTMLQYYQQARFSRIQGLCVLYCILALSHMSMAVCVGNLFVLSVWREIMTSDVFSVRATGVKKQNKTKQKRVGELGKPQAGTAHLRALPCAYMERLRQGDSSLNVWICAPSYRHLLRLVLQAAGRLDGAGSGG